MSFSLFGKAGEIAGELLLELLFLSRTKVLRSRSSSLNWFLVTSVLRASVSHQEHLSSINKILLMLRKETEYWKFYYLIWGIKNTSGAYCCDSIGRPLIVRGLFGLISPSSSISWLDWIKSSMSSFYLISSFVRAIDEIIIALCSTILLPMSQIISSNSLGSSKSKSA